MSRPLSISDPPFTQGSQEGNPGGNSATKATSSIGNVSYEAAQAGSSGNDITVSHQLAPATAATHAELDIGGMTYSAKNAGAAGNDISIAHQLSPDTDAVKASRIIGGMTYSADAAGAAGNSISISHVHSPDAPAVKANRSIGGMTYTAHDAGAAGNNISVSHELAPDTAAVKASRAINGMTYTAHNAGMTGNSISIAHQLAPVTPAAKASRAINGMTYTAHNAGAAGNSISVTHQLAPETPAVKANRAIDGMTYTARTEGNAGNSISIAHQLAPVTPAVKASRDINGLTYTARTAGNSGNSISLTHQLASSTPAVKASKTISGMTYTADVAGAAGNSVSVTLTQGSAGSTGTATLTRNMSVGTASFSITEKSGYYGSPTTVKLTSSAVQTPIAQLPASSTGDEYLNYTSLLLRAGQSAVPQNDYWSDKSSNAFSIARTGNVQQGSVSPYAKADGYWGVYFDGNGDSSTVPDSDAFWFTGDFTIEAWIFPTASVAQTVVAHWLSGSAGACSFVLALTATNAIRFSYGIGLSNLALQTGNVVTANQWNHIAVTRSGADVKIFCNGSLALTGTISGALNNCTNSLTIGRTTTDYFYGSISNLRLVKGSALYTAAFTPSTTPLTAVAGTSLLTCQSNRFIDNSTNNFAITVAGDVAVSPFGPFASSSDYSPDLNGGSVYFDGASDYLTAPASSAFNFGTGDFTVEAWVWWDGTYDSGGGRVVYATASGGGPDQLGIFTGGIFFGSITASGVFPKINSWSHVAGTRSGTTVRIFLNGALVGSGTYASAVGSSTSAPKIGVRLDGATYYYNWKGFISDLRVVKGTAVYTAAFTPPSSPLSAISGTSLLLPFGNASIVDMSGCADIETVGNASSSSTVTKFASKSMRFYGNDYLSISTPTASTNNPLSIGVADFTIEAWIYPTAALTNYAAIYASFGGARTGAYLLRTINTGKLAFYIHPALDVVTSTSTIATNTWTHVAVARSGGTIRLYVNGVLEASAANTTNLVNDPAHPATVGGYWQTVALEPNGYFTGYIEDLRLTRGVGRYFSPASITRTLTGSTELIRFPTGTTVAQLLSVVGPSGTNPSSRVSISSSSSGTLSATEPSPNNGVITSGGTAAQTLLVSTSGNDITVRIAGEGSTNAAIKTAVEANASAAALVDLSNPTGSASVTTKTFLTGGADLIPASLGSSLVGSAITVSVPAGTTNSALKTYLESVAGIAGGSGIVDLSNPSGNTPTSSGPLNLQGGADLIPGSLSAAVVGSTVTISVPAGTTNLALKTYLESVAGIAGGSGIIDLSSPSGNAPTSSGPLNLQSGADLIPGSLGASVVGAAITIRVPTGTANSALKTYLESVGSVSTLVDLSNPSGNAPTSSGPLNLQNGADLIPGSLGASVVGSAVTVSVPAGTTNSALKTYLESVGSVSTLVDLSNPSGNAPTSSGPLSLQGGADLVPGSLGSSLVGSAITINVPAGTTNSALKTYLESVDGIAGSNRILDLSDPAGNAPTSSGPLSLQGGTEQVPGTLGVSVVGSAITINVPSSTTNTDLKNYLDSVASVSALVDTSNPTGNAPISSGPLNLQNGADFVPGALSSSVTGKAITVGVPAGTTNESLKTYLELTGDVSALVSLSNPGGNAPTSSGPLSLAGGTDEIPGELAVSVSGNALTVSVPASTLAADVASAINGDNTAASLVTATATDSGLASTTGSAQLAGGQG
jgi:hypothetical protein